MSTELRTADRILSVTNVLLTVIVGFLAALTAGAISLHGDVRELKAEVRITSETTKEAAGDLKAMNINAARIDALEDRMDRWEAKLP